MAVFTNAAGRKVEVVRGEKMNGCIINTAGQVASEPNRISIAINKSNYTHDMVAETGIRASLQKLGGRFEFLYVDLVEVTVRLPYRGGSSRNQRTRFQTRDEID